MPAPNIQNSCVTCVLSTFLACSGMSLPLWSAAASDEVENKPWELSLTEIRARSLSFSPGRSFKHGDWPGNARVAVLLSFDADNESLAIVEEGGADPLVSSMYQFGTRRGLKRVLAVLEEYQVPATFFVPAAVMELQPGVPKSILASGLHEFGVHGWIHERANKMTIGEHRETLRKSIEVIVEHTGQRPVGYRPPYGIITEDTIPLLQEMGFVYDSAFLADDVPYELLQGGEPTGLIELPVSLNLEDSLLDPMNSFTAGIQSPGDTLDSYKRAFDAAYSEGGMVLVLMHPHVTGKLSRIHVLKDFIEHINSFEGVWFGTLRDAAEHFRGQLDSHPASPSDD